MKLSQQLQQRITINQNLQLNLQMLSFSNEELAEQIQEESLENPLLEIESYPTSFGYTASSPKKNHLEEAFYSQDHLHEPESLKAFLLKQKDQSFYSQEVKGLIELLISYLDERGYLRVSPSELALKNNISFMKILKALKALQSFEPWGVGARNLEECLLIQMKQKKIEEPRLKQLISYHLELLKDKKYPYIARELNTNIEEVKRLSALLRRLQPNPAFNFSFEPTVFLKPDLYIYQKGSSFSVLFNKDSLPQLRVSPFYLNHLCKKSSLRLEEKKYLRNKKKAAEFFLQAIQQRESRLVKVANYIIKHQEEFLYKGFSFIKPLRMIDLAQELGVHVSTVSRATNNKYVSTPQGIIALKDFFVQAIRSPVVSVSITKINTSIKKWVKEENPLKPLSDESLKKKIQQIFKVDLTRRRVTQYRVSLNIPQARLRKLGFLYTS